MKYLSVCSGIEAATSAWHHMGWEPVAFSEIDAFPSAVLKHHYPTVPNLGDMSKFKEWNLGTIDLLVGGTPCQSFSVAGLRKGLDDPRGNLMLTFGAIARHLSPRWLVWENVPGVLSSNGGKDFGAFLGMLGELGYGFAYRVLDAQYFGVAQRRRRVFVVGCLGNWRDAAAVLFELASLSGNPPPSREARKVTPTLSASGTGVSRVGFNCEDEWFIPQTAGTLDRQCGGGKLDHQYAQSGQLLPTWWDGAESAASLTTRCHDQFMPDKGNFAAVVQPIPFRKSKRAQSVDDDESWVDGEVANTINLFDQGDTRTTHAVVQTIPIHDKATRHQGGGDTRNGDGAGNGLGVGKPGDPCPTLTAGDKHAIAFTSEQTPKVSSDLAHTLTNTTFKHNQMVAFSSNMSVPDCQIDVSPTLKLGGQGGGNPPAIAFNGDQSEKTRSMGESIEHTPTLRADGPCHVATAAVGTDCYNGSITGDVAATMGTPGSSVNASGPTVMQSMAVRRLTPRECERLQGFPDDHTLIPWRGKDAPQCPDGPRYKALGNSMAVPVMRWIGERIRMVNELPK
jgi:DNA (cytosine-5)-methyltransferase 1